MSPEDVAQLALYGAGFFGVAAIGTDFVRNESKGRVLYWVFAYIAVSCLALWATPDGWAAVAEATLTGAALAVGYAFFATRFIKIGGRVYAADTEDTSEANSYDGEHSAAFTWWMMAIGACLVAVGLVATKWMPALFIVVAVGSLFSIIYGYEDGARGFGYARGQHLPFSIAAVASIVAAGIPLLCYLGAYRFGSRRPGYGKHDAVRRRRERLNDN